MKTETVKVLLIDDDEDDYILTRELFSEVKLGKYSLDWAPSYEEGLRVAGCGAHHVCLVDYRLGERSGVELIREAREARLTTPMILLTGQGDHEVDVAAMEAGATDYLIKDETSPARLERTIRYAVRLNVERCRAETEIRAYAQKQAAVAEIGRSALTGGELKDLFTSTLALVARTLGVEYCEVLELVPEDDALVLRAGVGWKAECLIEPATVSAGRDSMAGFTLLADEPVVVKDLRTETRFSGPAILHEHGVVSGVSVIIRRREQPYGILGVHTTSLRGFVVDDVNFLNTVANVLAEAIGRKRAEDEVRQSEARCRRVIESNMLGILHWDLGGAVTAANDAFLKMVGYTQQDLDAGRLRWSDMTPPEFRKITDIALEELAAFGVCETYEKEYIRKNGSRIAVLVGAAMFEGQENGVSFVLDISDRKRAEEALRHSEIRMSEAQRIAHLGSWEWDVPANKTQWSEEQYRIFGLQPQKSGPTIESIMTYIHPDDQALVERAVTKALEEKVFPELEYRVRRLDGTLRVVQANAGIVVDDQGHVIKMVGTVQDITERKRAEEILRESEERYRTLFESIDEGFCTIQMLFDGNDKPIDYRFLQVNPSFEKQTGIQNAPGRRMLEIAPQHEELWFEIYGKIALTGEPARFENQAVQLQRWFDVYAFRVGEPQERKVAILFTDSTERKHAEDSVRESEERYRLLFEGNPQPMWVFDLETLSFLEVNEAAINHYGYSREEFRAMTIKDIRPQVGIPKQPDNVSGLNSQLEEAGIQQHQKKDGTIIDVEISAHELTLYQRPTQIVLAYDVTERRTLEKLLRQSQKMEAIGTLAGGIAHDFNNILAAIMGYTELVQMDVIEGGLAHGHLEQVLKASARARDLVRQILTFSRQKDPEREALQLQPIIAETLKLLRGSLPSTIEIQQDIDNTTPLALVDEIQIQQVLLNLCGNAAQAMKEGSGVLGIGLAGFAVDRLLAIASPELTEGPHVRLTISDNGCGMDRATQARIFDPFFTTKVPGKGTGLGLAVVHGVIKSHGGAIKVYSEPGIGTTVNIYLPAYEGQADASDHNSEPVPRGNGEHILLVDDEEALVSLGKSMLEHLGYRVTTRTNGVEALAVFRSQPDAFDLVITDQTMPHMNGTNLANALLQIRPALPVILTTGYSNEMSSENAKTIGIRELLLKPNTLQALAEAIGRTLGQNRKV